METSREEYPAVMNLDGFRCEVIRDGETVTRCFTDLTHEEQLRYLSCVTPDIAAKICVALASALRGLCEMLNIQSFPGG